MSKACRRLRTIFARAVTLATRPQTSGTGKAKPPTNDATGSSSLRHIPLFIGNVCNFETSILRLLKDMSAVEARLEDQKRHFRGREGFAVRLMSLYGKAGLFGGARKMPELGCARLTLSLNALLEAAIDSEEWEMIDVIFRDLSKEF